MDGEAVARVLIALGVVMAIVGVGVLLLAKAGFAGLPGDISLRGNGWGLYYPIVTSIVVSIGLTVLVNVFLRLR